MNPVQQGLRFSGALKTLVNVETYRSLENHAQGQAKTKNLKEYKL
jgi:hypothetical protein